MLVIAGRAESKITGDTSNLSFAAFQEFYLVQSIFGRYNEVCASAAVGRPCARQFIRNYDATVRYLLALVRNNC